MKENSESNIVEKLSLDGGILIALAIGEKGIDAIKEKILQGKIQAFTSNLALTEMLYITYNELRNSTLLYFARPI